MVVAEEGSSYVGGEVRVVGQVLCKLQRADDFRQTLLLPLHCVRGRVKVRGQGSGKDPPNWYTHEIGGNAHQRFCRHQISLRSGFLSDP